MQGLPQLVDRCADNFLSSFQNVWVPDESGPEYDYQYEEAISKSLAAFEIGFRAEVRRRIVTRLRQRNTCVPISKLPQELLQLIFRFNLIASSGNRAHGYVRTMVILRSVSWGWRALLERSPSLWGHITSSDHPEFISKAFENSKEAPLHLKYSRKRDGSHSAFLDKMFPHLHRLESISIHRPTHEDFAKYLNSGAPLLKRMILLGSGEWEPDDPACPLSGSWTLLEELSIRCCLDIEWGEVKFGQLRVLDIGLCGTLEISWIFRLIQQHQRLETLKLDDITFFTSSTSLAQSITPVVLSHLKDLTLSSLVLADPGKVNDPFHHPTLHVLRHIRVPSCTKFTLHTSIESESPVDPEDLRSLLPSPLDVLAHPSLNDPQTSQTTRSYMSASFSEHSLALTVEREPGREFKYEVKLDDIPRSITTRWLKSALEGRPGVTLQGFKLHVSIDEDSQLDEIVAFQASEAVTLLSVEMAFGAEDLREEVETRLLQILATPYTSASGATVMTFPRLLGVEFDGWEGRGEAVLEMIRNRFGTPGVEAHRPDSININSFNRKRFEEFLWDSLGEIRKLYRFKAILFGDTCSWPWWSPIGRDRSGSPESGWPPLDDFDEDI